MSRGSGATRKPVPGQGGRGPVIGAPLSGLAAREPLAKGGAHAVRVGEAGPAALWEKDPGRGKPGASPAPGFAGVKHG